MTDHKLFTYQKDGAAWLSNRQCALLADEMGLGKTVQAIRAVDEIEAKKVLVVCPAVARINWRREFERWTETLPDVEIVSFEYALKYSEKLKRRHDALIIDESHYLKSVGAKRSQAILGSGGLVHFAKRSWLLSGTPAPNHAAELWPMLYTFGVTKLAFNDFVYRYCETIATGYGTGQKIIGTKKGMIPELRSILSRIMLRRKKSEVLKDLPPIFFQTVYVEPGEVKLPPQDQSKLDQEVKFMELKLSTSQEEIAVLEALAQSVSTLRRYTGLQKIEPVSEMIAGELELGLMEKVVIFAIHKDVVQGLRLRLKAFDPVVISGATPEHERQLAVDRFQADPKCRVFIGNIIAAGTNLTLTASHHVVIVEPDWVPGNNSQAAMRCHRIGQDKPVTVRFVSLSNPIDERVTQVVKKKTSELNEIFGC